MSASSAPKHTGDRIVWFRLAAITVVAVVGFRLAYLQLIRGEHYTRLADAQRVRQNALFPHRGSIFLSEQGSDRTFLIASTELVATAYLVPREVHDQDGVANLLADVILRYRSRADQRREETLRATGQITQEEFEAEQAKRNTQSAVDSAKSEEDARADIRRVILQKLENRNDPYEPILSGGELLDEEAIAELRSAAAAGIAFREVPTRVYPEGSLAAHLLGFVRTDRTSTKGEYGIEAGLDATLRGVAGYQTVERDVTGRLITLGQTTLVPVENGADVVLTVDRVLQTMAERIARTGRERFKAERAQVIMMDPNTGAILALAAAPAFDPNNPGIVRDLRAFQDPVVSDLFEPGSVIKPVVMAAALEAGILKPDTTMEDRGPVRIGPYTINTYDGKHHGTITMTNILEQSNNIGMVWVAGKLGTDRLYQFFRRVGIGDRIGTPLPGEAASELPAPQTWGDTRTATAGFGQGIVTTPLHVLTANAALVNGGRLVQPFLVKEIKYPDGRSENTSPNVIRQVVSPETSEKLRAMLVSVVEKGVAQRARVPGYDVGGKTGTAQVVDPTTGRYSTEKKIISFVGFAPAENPAFIALVKLDNPEGLSLASGTAAPLFHDFARQALEYLRISPSRPTPGPRGKGV